jgi:hypothetical protein
MRIVHKMRQMTELELEATREWRISASAYGTVDRRYFQPRVGGEKKVSSHENSSPCLFSLDEVPFYKKKLPQ